MLGADEILKYANVEPFFGPLMGGALKSILPVPEKPTNESEKLIRSAFELLKANSNQTNLTNSFLDQLKDLNLEGDLTKDEFEEMRKLLTDKQEDLKSKDSALLPKKELKSKLSEIIDKW